MPRLRLLALLFFSDSPVLVMRKKLSPFAVFSDKGFSKRDDKCLEDWSPWLPPKLLVPS